MAVDEGNIPYPDDPEKNAAQLNMAFKAAFTLYGMLGHIYARLVSEYPWIVLGKPLSAVFNISGFDDDDGVKAPQ